MSVLCLDLEIVGDALSRQPAPAVLRASFDYHGRFSERLGKVDDPEREVWHGEL